MDKAKTLVTIFREDKTILEEFMKGKKDRIPTMADAIKIAVEYSRAHGVFK